MCWNRRGLRGQYHYDSYEAHPETSMKEEVLYTIILNLHKVYYALDRDRCMDILEGYLVGPWIAASSAPIGTDCRW